MPPHKCSYFRCTNVSNMKSMFRFPWKEPKRLKLWLNNCGNMQLANMATQRLRARYLCVDHFDQKHVRNHKGARTTLLRHAIPEHYQNQSLPGEKKHTEDTIPFIFFCVSCATYVCDTWQDELHQRHYVVRGPRGCPMVCK
ncbi:uncharacterized protein LOC114359555 isoform X1 [Ostrinia furnacalis]|uniref:uncharacterized protein LOC114359555 isoform X1 n=1 Tax=Ostrinia furnacalis TaxID=93504 RepID=UPI0010398099|nr:uncharacterized protein LOC114359555 isoform X1 [Ostrinia furnacalis]